MSLTENSNHFFFFLGLRNMVNYLMLTVEPLSAISYKMYKR